MDFCTSYLLNVPPSKECTACLFRVTELCQVDAEVIWRKKVCHCILLSASSTSEALSKGPSFEILTPMGLGQSCPSLSSLHSCDLPNSHQPHYVMDPFHSCVSLQHPLETTVALKMESICFSEISAHLTITWCGNQK